MYPYEPRQSVALRIGKAVLMLAGAALIIWLVLRALGSVHRVAGV